MRRAAIILFLLAVSLQSVAQGRSGAAKKPNIIFIIADDLGYGDVGCYGQQKIETPNIDRMARMGMRFTQFYAGTAVCAPSRASFMTGLHTGHTAVRGNRPYKPEGQAPLPDSVITFPMLLQGAGYATAAFGKWGLGYITTSGDPAKKGIDEFYGYNCQSLAHNYYPDHLWHNHERIDFPENATSRATYSADLIHQQALKFLGAKHEKPFFLFLPYTLPHAELAVPRDDVYRKYVKKFYGVDHKSAPPGDELHALPDSFPHAAFAAMVSRLDKYVGEILDMLKQNGMEENTLVIFTSDNGPHKEKGGDPAFFNSSSGLRGIKRDLYEGGIRVPFIAYWKGFTKAGTVSGSPAALWDMYPTFLELAGIPVTKKIDGISLVPALQTRQQSLHEYLYWELHEGGGRQAVRYGRWKGVRLNVSQNADSPIELYDMQSDPQEKINVSAAHPQIVRKMKDIMNTAHIPNSDWPLLFSAGK